MKNSQAKLTLVHLGCGPGVIPTEWVDCDGSWNAWVNCLPFGLARLMRTVYSRGGGKAKVYPPHVRYLDLLRPLPFENNSVDAFYAAHVWEHLYLADGENALRECWRACRFGGLVRLVVPDLFTYCSDYVVSKAVDRAHTLHRQLLYRNTARETRLVMRLYTALTDFHTHKFMYDSEALTELFRRAGFVDMKTCGYLETSIPKLEQVENIGRLGRSVGFAVEGRKPV